MKNKILMKKTHIRELAKDLKDIIGFFMLETKIKALRKYDSEMRNWPHSRSIEAIKHLAMWRGATVGLEAAESFCLIRNIVLDSGYGFS